MSDLIDRQEAVQMAEDIIGKSAGYKAFAILHMLKELPSAQPESTMGQVNDTAQSTNDCISRKLAMKCDSCKHRDLNWWEEPCDSCCPAHSGYEPREDEDD